MTMKVTSKTFIRKTKRGNILKVSVFATVLVQHNVYNLLNNPNRLYVNTT